MSRKFILIKEIFWIVFNKGTYLIDMTTTKSDAGSENCRRGKKGLHVLDAPVTGGDIGAKNGTLSILVGVVVVKS